MATDGAGGIAGDQEESALRPHLDGAAGRDLDYLWLAGVVAAEVDDVSLCKPVHVCLVQQHIHLSPLEELLLVFLAALAGGQHHCHSLTVPEVLPLQSFQS